MALLLILTNRVMIIFYAKPGCPYCKRVKEKLDELGLEYEERDFTNPEIERELMEVGHKHQVPYIIDEESGAHMYESGDIVAYLEERYGGSH